MGKEAKRKKQSGERVGGGGGKERVEKRRINREREDCEAVAKSAGFGLAG